MQYVTFEIVVEKYISSTTFSGRNFILFIQEICVVFPCDRGGEMDYKKVLLDLGGTPLLCDIEAGHKNICTFPIISSTPPPPVIMTVP